MEIRAPGFVIHGDGGYTYELAKDSVGPGWGFLIEILFDYKNHMKDNDTEITITQVKEKFGLLRIYSMAEGPFGPDSFGFIQGLECVSGYFCEDCGNRGTKRNDLTWVQTLCNEHYEMVKEPNE